MDYFEKDFVVDDIIYKPTRKGATKTQAYIENAMDDMCDYVKKWEKTGKKRGADFGKTLIIMRNDDADFDSKLEEYVTKQTTFNNKEYTAIGLTGAGATLGAAVIFPPAALGTLGFWLVGQKLDARKQRNRIRRTNKVFEKLKVQ